MNIKEIWQELQTYDGTGSKSFDLANYCIQFYKGAMEIPLIAFIPKTPFHLAEERMRQFSEILSSLKFELDCVEDGANYKINRSDDKQYIGRITTDALKLHAIRIKECGWESFNKIVTFFLNGETV